MCRVVRRSGGHRVIKTLITLLFFTTVNNLIFAQNLLGYDAYRASLEKIDQDAWYNGVSGNIAPGAFYGFNTYVSQFYGGEVGNDLSMGFYAQAAFGMHYNFSGGGFNDNTVGLNFSIGPGIGLLYMANNNLQLGLKSYFDANFDRISTTGVMLKPTFQFGQIFIEGGSSIPLGNDKLKFSKLTEVGAYYMLKDIGFGLNYEVRTGKNNDGSKATENIINIVFEFH